MIMLVGLVCSGCFDHRRGKTDSVRAFAEDLKAARAYTSINTPLELESAIQTRIREKSIQLKQADSARLLAADLRKNSS